MHSETIHPQSNQKCTYSNIGSLWSCFYPGCGLMVFSISLFLLHRCTGNEVGGFTTSQSANTCWTNTSKEESETWMENTLKRIALMRKESVLWILLNGSMFFIYLQDNSTGQDTKSWWCNRVMFHLEVIGLFSRSILVSTLAWCWRCQVLLKNTNNKW